MNRILALQQLAVQQETYFPCFSIEGSTITIEQL